MDRRIRRKLKRLVAATNTLIRPLGCEVTGTGPDAVGSQGDDRSVALSITITIPATMNVMRAMEISSLITNRVRGIGRVLIDIPND
jgi:hypothetical protein